MNLQRERELIERYNKNNFNDVGFKNINELFEIKNNPAINKEKIILSNDYNDYPYFTRTENNNGELCYTKSVPNGFLIKGNAIAVGLMAMKFFYKSSDFCAGQFTKTLSPKFNFNSDLSLFYITYLNKNSEILKANLVRDFDNITNNIRTPNISSNEIEIFISGIKKMVVQDLVRWYSKKLETHKTIIDITNS